jgi:hypothetical protein
VATTTLRQAPPGLSDTLGMSSGTYDPIQQPEQPPGEGGAVVALRYRFGDLHEAGLGAAGAAAARPLRLDRPTANWVRAKFNTTASNGFVMAYRFVGLVAYRWVATGVSQTFAPLNWQTKRPVLN